MRGNRTLNSREDATVHLLTWLKWKRLTILSADEGVEDLEPPPSGHGKWFSKLFWKTVCLSLVEGNIPSIRAEIPLPGIYPTAMKTQVHIQTSPGKFTAAWFVGAEKWKQRKSPSLSECYSKCDVPTQWTTTRQEENEILRHAMLWMNSKTFNERS